VSQQRSGHFAEQNLTGYIAKEKKASSETSA